MATTSLVAISVKSLALHQMNDLLFLIVSVLAYSTGFYLGFLSGRNQNRDAIGRARAKGFYEGQHSRDWEVKLLNERIRHLEAQARTITTAPPAG